jgi:hypothetical protein
MRSSRYYKAFRVHEALKGFICRTFKGFTRPFQALKVQMTSMPRKSEAASRKVRKRRYS